MDSEERSQEDERRRPKVVDKRVSSGGHQPTRPTPPPEPPAQAAPAPQTAAPGPQTAAPQVPAPPAGEPAGPATPGAEPEWTAEEEAAARQMAQEIAERPGLDWVVNTAVTLANVAATKLQMGDPADAQLCIDALAGLLDKTQGRLEDADAPLRQTLAQLQMAYAQRASAPPGG
jgi:hypothetical protein